MNLWSHCWLLTLDWSWCTYTYILFYSTTNCKYFLKIRRYERECVVKWNVDWVNDRMRERRVKAKSKILSENITALVQGKKSSSCLAKRTTENKGTYSRRQDFRKFLFSVKENRASSFTSATTNVAVWLLVCFNWKSSWDITSLWVW